MNEKIGPAQKVRAWTKILARRQCRVYGAVDLLENIGIFFGLDILYNKGMTLRIMVGGASSGKSNRLVTDMAERSLRLKNDRFFAIVPEQATLKMQQSVVAHLKSGATFNIDVVSFDRLAHVVFADLGIDASNILDDTGKILILRQVLEDCKDDLEVYQHKVHLPGFVQRIKSAVTELKQYGIDDNQLYLMQESAQEFQNQLLFSKLQDLRLISRKFQDRIRDAYRAQEELLDLFASCVPDSQRIKDSHIYLDGFTGFTPVQYKLLKQFLRFAQDVTVAVTIPMERICNNCPEYDLFHLSNETISKLKDAAAEAGAEVEISEGEGEGKEIATEAGAEEKRPPAAGIYSAADQKDEVVFAAKEILRLVKEQGLRYKEIAVITSDMEAYHKLAESVFADAGIPCFIDHKSDITDNPLSRFVLAALDLIEERFSYDAVFSYLKTGLADVEPDQVCQLENYCLEFGIKGFRAFNNDFEKNRKLRGPEPTEEQLKEDAFLGQAWNLDEINHIRNKLIESAGAFYKEAGKGNLKAADYTNALKRLFRQNHVAEKIEAKADRLEQEGRLKEEREYRQVYNLMEELLEKMRLLSGDHTISVHDFRLLLESGLSEIKVGVIPPTIDTLTVGDLTRTRLDGIRVLFLLGVNAGKIPSSSDPAGILSSRDREFLKNAHFEMAPTAMENMCNQRFYLYLMLNKPTDLLYLTYANADMEGESLEPSYILDELDELIGDAQIEEIREMPDIKWERRALEELSATIRKDPDEALLTYFAKEDPRLIRKIIDAAFFSNVQTELDDQVALDLYGEVLSGSVSRYEKYSECPFKHFLQYGIRMEKRPEYEIAATDMGTIYHTALEVYSGKLEEEGYSFRRVSDEISRRIARESVAYALEQMPSDILDSSARNEFLVKRIMDVTVKTTEVLRAQVRAGLFEPTDYELEFKTSLSDHVRFKGKIDRVDLYEAGDVFVKIIDYKSGEKKFKINDIYLGLQLQLVAYMKEALAHYKKEYPDKEVKPGGVYYYRINDHFAKNEEEAMDRFKLSGLTSCDEGVVAAVDSELGPDGSGTSNIIPVRCNKDGSFNATSQVANSTEFGNLLDFVSGKVGEISAKILEGDIRIEPYYESDRNNACTYCDYKDICKFESGSFGTDWKEKTEMSTKEMEAEIYGRI